MKADREIVHSTKEKARISLRWLLIGALVLAVLTLLGAAETGRVLAPHAAGLGLTGEDVRNYMLNISAGFFAAAAVTILVERVTGETAADATRAHIDETLSRMKDVALTLAQSGTSAFQPRRDETDYVRMLDSTKVRFDAVGTSLEDVTSRTFLDHVERRLAMQRTLQVRLLLINPLSAAAYLKDISGPYLGAADDVPLMIANAMARVRRLRDKLDAGSRSRFQVRLYRTLPTTSCVITDKQMNLAFYDEIQGGHVAPAWRLDKIGGGDRSLYAHYAKNFDAIWTRADTIDLFDSAAAATMLQGIEAEAVKLASLRDREEWRRPLS